MYRMGWSYPDLCATPDSIVREALSLLAAEAEAQAEAQGDTRGASLRAAHKLIRDQEVEKLQAE